MMAQNGQSSDGERQREAAFKLDYPQQSDVLRGNAKTADRGVPLKAVAYTGNSGPGGVYAHANMASSLRNIPSTSQTSVPSTGVGRTPLASPVRGVASVPGGSTSTHLPATRHASGMSTSSSTSRNQLVNASYSPQVGATPTPLDHPEEAFAMRPLAGDRHAPMPPGPAPSHGRPEASSRHSSGSAFTLASSTAGTATVPATTASLLERLEKCRQSGPNGQEAGSSIASSLEQNNLQRVGSLGNLLPATSSLPPRSATASLTPTRTRSSVPSFSLSGTPSSVLRYNLSGRPVTGLSGSQSVAGGTRTAELEAKLQRANQDRAHLEGKLEALTAECGLALTQRSELQQQLASSQAKLEHETSSSELAGRREQQLRADLAEVSEQLNQALQQNREVQQAGADWSAVQEIQDQCQELQSALDHLRQSNQDQAAENAQLRADLEAAHATARATGNEHTRLATEAAALSNDLQLAEENNKILQQQLSAAHITVDGVRDELANARAANLSLSVEMERQGVAAVDTEAELRQLQSQTIQQQGAILTSLEGFEAEAAAREEALQREAREKASAADALEKAYREAARECAELLRVQTHMKSEMQGTERQAAEFKQLAERAVADKNMLEGEMAKLKSHHAQMDRELDAAAQTIAGHEEGAAALRTEVYVAQQSATMEQEKRKQLEEDLDRLRNSMAQLEGGLRDIQREADGRESEAEEERSRILRDVEDERQRNAQREAELEDALARSAAEQRAQSLKLVKLEQEREGIQADIGALTDKHSELTEELLAARAGMADAERTALAAQRSANDANHRLEDEKQRAESQMRTAAATHAMELERALNSKVAAEAEAERAKQQLESHQQGVESELRAAVESATLAHKQLQDQHRDLASRLAESDRQKERLEHEANRCAKRAERLQEEVSAIGRELAAAESARAVAESDGLRVLQEAEQRELELQDQVTALQEELGEALHLQQVARTEAEAVTNQLAEDLERERGRMEGISSAQATLRNHAGSLEAQLANREYSLGQLSSQTANVLAEKLAEDEAVGRKIQRLTSELETLQKENSRLQQQLDVDAGRDRTSLSDIRQQLVQSQAESRQQAEEVKRLRQQLDSHQQEERERDSAMTQAAATLRASQQDVEQLRRSLLEKSSQESAMSEQLRSVSWQNEQLTAEVAALKEQSSLAEMRHKREVEGLRQAAPITPDVDGRQLPVFAAPRPLSLSRSSRASPSSSSDAVGVTTTDGPGSALVAPGGGSVAASNATGALPTREVASLRGQLGRKHKTISGLQTCLSSLRGEMEKLQQQMARQSDAVQASNTTCRALESRLRGIKPSPSVSSLHRSGSVSGTPPRSRSPNNA